MISPLSKEKIKKFFKVEFANQTNAATLTGATLFTAFLRKIKLKERIEPVLGKEPTKAFLQVMMGVFAGADSMEKVAALCKEPVIRGYIKEPVCETQIVRVLKKARPSQIQGLHDFSLSLGFLAIVDDNSDASTRRLIVDATAREKFGHQEGVEKGYLSDDVIASCYQYLLFRLDTLDTALYGTIRGGAAHSQNGILEFLKMIFPFAYSKSLELLADSGYFNGEVLRYCIDHYVRFYIAAPMSVARQQQARASQIVWRRLEADPNAEYAEYATDENRMYQWREVFKRVPKQDANGKDGGFDIYCVATNDLAKNGREVFEHYNGRARIEGDNDELKDDYNLGRIVTQSFDVNDIITQATIILFQLVNTFKKYCLDKADSKKKLKTLRDEIFNIPGRVVSSARRITFRIFSNLLDPRMYARVASRIEFLRIALVALPYIDTS